MDPALLLSPPELHSICLAVVPSVDHRRLLVLSDGLQTADQLRIVEEVSPRC